MSDQNKNNTSQKNKEDILANILEENPFSKENRKRKEEPKEPKNESKLQEASFKKTDPTQPNTVPEEKTVPIQKDPQQETNPTSKNKIILSSNAQVNTKKIKIANNKVVPKEKIQQPVNQNSVIKEIEKKKIKMPSKKLSFEKNKSKPNIKITTKGKPQNTEKIWKKSTTEKNKISTKTPTKTLSVQKLLFGFLGLGGLFVGLFYLMLLWGTLSGNASNPLFETLGMDPDGLKTLLLTMTNTIFGILALIMLITTLIFLFRGFMADKNATDRRRIFTTTGIYFIVFILSVGLWIFLYWVITGLSAGPLIKSEDSLIDTIPKNTIDLDSPIRVEFDVSEKLSKIIPISQVRQINWDFNEDGIFDASGLNVSHRFIDKGINNGIYNVKASISYFSEKTQKEEIYETIRQVIVNNESVLAVISASPESGVYPLMVELSGAESSDPDGEIVWYEWDLDNDGTFELRNETPLVKKSFETVGEHKVILRVTGTNTDDYDVVEKTIKVKNPEGTLRAEIGTDGLSEGYGPLKVIFDGSMSFIKEGKIIRYEWITEDSDKPFVGRKMQKVFRTPGEHVVRLIIQSDLGEKHETKKIIKVLEEDSVANLVIGTTPALIGDQEILHGIVPFEVTFNAEKSEVKNAFEWQWDFQNDGIVDAFAIAEKHIFRKPGTYDVKLIIVDANEKTYEKIQKVVVERSGVRAKISATPGAGEVPLEVTFDGSGSSSDDGDIRVYTWEIPGIDPIRTGAKFSYLFKQIGNFTVELEILTSTGKTARTETIISVRAPNIRSEFTFSPKVGSAPLNVTLNPTSSKGLVKEYLWDFGDGVIKKQYRALPMEHTYKKEGKYTIKLRLMDSNGVISTSEQVIEVRPAR